MIDCPISVYMINDLILQTLTLLYDILINAASYYGLNLSSATSLYLLFFT
jgi:hypothetical protein